ncbi:Carbon-nitrogen hydrolase [Cichlidogyrus casuarinus]|uniref:omega-amidase n=1 Tax=Cichlidogyrus casuarinus TaxID=1844966 RepID=A0ABD2Q5K7_9PLAT
MASKLRLALIQSKVLLNKSSTLQNLSSLIKKACTQENKPDLICLPECFNTPYGHDYFAEYSEEIPGGITSQLISSLARENSVSIVAGSIPEKRDGKIYNTSVVYDNAGSSIGNFSKLHLFDVNFTFIESDSLSSGNKLLDFTLGQFKIGIGICYDIRFPELSLVYANKRGCNVLIFPGAFSTTTGPAHWELLARARALDTQSYVAVCSPACDQTASYISHAHSMVVGPWGNILCNAGKEETIVYADLTLEEINRVRQAIPTGKQRRLDIYTQPESI